MPLQSRQSERMVGEVSRTSRSVAAHRAVESDREGALFVDPFARRLAGEEGFAVARDIATLSGLSWTDDRPSMFALRTRFFDDRVVDVVATQGVRQIVIVGAGMDTRAYRIPWPAGTTLYEIDRRATFAHKGPILAAAGARARCVRRAVATDLRDDWGEALLAAGFHPDAPTVWLAEGLLYYLNERDAGRLLERLTTLSRPGSTLLADVAHPMMRDLPSLQRWRDALVTMGESFEFFTDDGPALLAAYGWETEACSIAEVGRRLGFPVDNVGALAVRRLLSGRRL
jgi:methyltransferase (TIGR00027 family)